MKNQNFNQSDLQQKLTTKLFKTFIRGLSILAIILLLAFKPVMGQNTAPVLGPIGNKSVDEQALLTFTVTATDADDPPQTLTFTMDAASISAGMSITTGGVFSWIPTEAQGGATYPVTITVTDDGTNPPNLYDDETFNIVVAEVNIVTENAKIGNPPEEWDISGAGDLSIQGFGTKISVNKGETIRFKIDVTDAANFTIKIYRLGYYQGLGARLQADLGSFSGTAQEDPIYDPATGLTDCGNWIESALWEVPTNAVSGIYIAKLTKTVGGVSSHIAFIVRDDAGNSDLLFKTSDATWQAYNIYGGNSLYDDGNGVPNFSHAVKVSYNRPFVTRGSSGVGGAQDWLFNAEYPMIRWLERNGYDVSYTTDLDMDKDLIGITPAGAGNTYAHRILLSVGHDEYWSAAERTKFENARNAGVHLAFFSGNEVYWKTRWEASIDGTNTPHRTLVCYKEGTMGEYNCGGNCDPTNIWTGLWRDGCGSNYEATDGCNPENALTGQISWDGTTTSIQVPYTYKNFRFWKNTSIATLGNGVTKTLPYGTLGYEWDWEQYQDYYPAGRITLSQTTSGSHTHKLSIYCHSSGALVFGAGTCQWSWGLDDNHDRGSELPSQDMQQATLNLFFDMDVLPATLQSGLILPAASSDVTSPVSVITTPLGGSFSANVPITISGTASDAGGIVAAVDVSIDGGLTWRPATGTTSWTFTWVPTAQGSVAIKTHAIDDSYNIEPTGTAPSPNVIVLTITEPVAPTCPCTIWDPSTVPVIIADGDASAAELGVKFRSKANGYITGIRFYKSSTNTGTHIGNLWSASGINLATATFINETATGWQEVAFGTPIQITTGTTYVASYHTSTGHYSEDDYYNFTQYGNTYYLEALADGVDGPNGVYNKSSVSAFPTTGYLSSNYYVDVVFNTTVGPDNTPPVVVSVNPSNNASGVAITNHPTAYFNEALNTSTVNSNTVLMTGPGTTPVAGTVSCTAGTVTFTPDLSLEYSTAYTLTLKGGYSTFHIEDLAGNGLASDYTWIFTTSAPPPPPPTEGPGGPILVISSASNPFSRYPVEILRAEGLNEFYAMDISQVTPAILNTYDVIILGEFSLSSYSSFVTELTTWVNAGGTLVALRPDAQLASLLGISPTGITLSDKYLLINTTSGPGVGLVNETIQFHGPADLYTLNGATSLATFYSDAITPTINPAVTQILVGSNGGKAIAFTYDLAKSVVYTRQGNPAWINQKRDGAIDPIRADDMFFPDWIDFNKIAIPQADEQQRLLSNIIIKGNLHRKPMPRFWFLPKGLKAAIVMTGDNHGDGGMKSRFERDISLSPPGCSINDWECVRSTGYLFVGSTFTNADAQYYNSLGFETALHVNSNCAWYTYDQYANFITNQMNVFNSTYPSIPSPQTHRLHCGAWSGFSTTAEVEAAKGLRLDANYYYWPNYWTQNRPGMFTGSGMPMRFAKLDGTIIDCYQLTTQIQDESWYPPVTPYTSFTEALLDKAIGPEGYYGIFCANMHFDTYPIHQGETEIVNSAQERGIPVISCKQMLDWLDGRNSSSFGSISWANNILSFNVAVGSGANNLRGMLPVNAGNTELIQLTKGGNNVTYTIETIKGISYAIFPATAGDYIATYGIDNIAPVITNVVATPHADGTATISWSTNEASDSRIDYDLDNETLDLNTYNASIVTSHSITLSGLLPSTAYYYRVTSTDDAIPGNSATFPPLTEAAYSFTMPYGICAQDQTKADFDLGTTGANTMVTMEGDGAVILKPAFIEDFSAGSLPAGWTTPAVWLPSAGGTTAFSGGQVILDGTHMASTSTFGPGSTLEFIATFTAGNYQNVGFTYNAQSDAPWAVIGRGNQGDNNLYARGGLINGGPESNLLLGSNLLGSPHNYKIKWNTDNFQFYVDGALVQTITITISSNMVIQISDYVAGGAILSVDWLSITPYASSGSFTSRVFDGGVSKLWQTASWTADLPASTSISILVRKGNTSVPDGSWTSFTQILSSGDLVGGTSRYIQYRADLATSNPIFTPVFKDITITCSNAGPDEKSPVISLIVATPYNNGTATITWITDEASDSKVDYGTIEGSLNLSTTNVNMVTNHSITLTGLDQNTTYYYRVTSKDIANNSRTVPVEPETMSFITPIPDVTPPVITGISAIPHTDGTAIIAWSTDEASDSKVDYGTSEGSLNLSETDISMVTSHTVILTDLTQELTYYYRVTSKDAGNYSATEPNPSIAPLNFVTPAVVNYCFIDQTKSNFSGGNTTNTYISAVSDGEVILKPTASAEFDEMPPESEWKSFQWVSGSGTTTISGGSLIVDGTRLNTEPSGLTFTTGSCVEFSAKYNIAQFQSIGFAGGTDAITPGGIFNTVPWASFATGEPGTYLIARVANPGGTKYDFTIPGSYLGTTHIYRIEWTVLGFNFYIDGNLVHAEPVVFANPMRVGIADYFAGGPTVTVDWIHASPFSSSGTFESRIYDAGILKTWGSAIWTADLPSGTTLLVSARKGNTPTPDASWSVYSSISASGASVGGTSRYIQYKLNLATADMNVTPVFKDISFECINPPVTDATAPSITNVIATPNQDGVSAIISWQTDEAADSWVEYGISPENLNLNASDNNDVFSHSILLAGLTPLTTYYFRVTSNDVANNLATLPNTPAAPLYFTTPAVVNYCFIDQTKSDFNLGNTTNTYISEITDGEVILKHITSAEFDEIPPESEWKSFQFVSGSGTSTISSGSLVVDGTRFNTEPSSLTYSTGTYIEFVATFNAAPFQSIGFGAGSDIVIEGGIFKSFPVAIFSTGSAGTTLMARIYEPNGIVHEHPISSSYLGTAHLYRIEWTVTGFNFSIDGSVIWTEPVVITTPMRVAIADLTAGGLTLSVDWIHVSPFSPSGTFESRIYDAGILKTWGSAIWTADLPSGTTLLVSARKGNTPTPDASWSVYSSISASGASVGGTSRYIQYKLNLATADMNVTPVFKDISFECINPPGTDEIAPVITNVVTTPNPDGVSALISWQTDEASDSRVDYGVSEGLLNSNTFDNNDVFSHTLTLTGLTQEVTYYFRVTSADASDNFSTSPNPPALPLSFTTPVQSVTCFNDQTFADFNAGTKTNTVITNLTDGEVTLKAKASAEFDVLPPTTEWQSFPWQTGGTSTIPSPPGGSLSVDGARFNTEPTTLTFGPGDFVEFNATFSAVAYQHIGFGGGSDATSIGGIFADLTFPYASIGTWDKSTGIYARTFKPNGSTTNFLIPGSYFNSPHLYRIEWTATGFKFYIDGDLKFTDPIIITDPMRVAIADYLAGGLNLKVDWIHTSYSSSGTFESRVDDAGSPLLWGTASWTADIAMGTNLAVSVRTGNTLPLSGSYTPVTLGGSVGVVSRYIQYKADFTTSNASNTAVLRDIAFTCSSNNSIPLVTLHPLPQTICEGNLASFTSSASGFPIPTAQWQVSTNGTDWSNIDGATNSTYSFISTAGDNGKQFHAQWSNSVGTVNSSSALLAVNPKPTGTLTAPATACEGNSISLTYSASSGTGPYSLVINGIPYNNVISGTPFSSGIIAVPETVTTIWTIDGGPDGNDAQPYELGVKFQSSVAGQVKGIRFYKPSALNGGTHIGHLWSVSGTQLAEATFTNETSIGWQQVNFTTPVTIQANTTYIASYYAPSGHYAFTWQYFASQSYTNGPLTALKSGIAGNNGVFIKGVGGGFPNQDYLNTNFWVDLVFSVGGSYNFSLTGITDVNGCNTTGALGNLTVGVNPAPLGNAAVTTPITCNGGTATVTIAATSGTAPITYTLGTTSQVGNGVFTGISAGTYSWSVTDANSCSSAIGSLIVTEPGPITVNGLLTYFNTTNTPLVNATINLKQGSTIIPSTPITGSGEFSFSNVCPGTYDVVVSTSEDIGGINVTDAAQTNYWGVFNTGIEKVRFYAGDVVMNNLIGSIDAGRILQYFLTQGSSGWAGRPAWTFWNSGQIISENPPVSGTLLIPSIEVLPGSGTTPLNLYGLVTGDFNQSFVPGGMKAVSESLALIYGENISVIPDMEFDLPLSAAMDMEVGAVSLIMNFPSDLLEVNGVYLSDDPNTTLMYSVSGDELRIGWNSLEPISLLDGESLLTLKVKVIGLPGEEGIRFKLAADPLNELADGDYNVINNAVLSIDVITTSMTGTGEITLSDRLTLANHPNPFTGKTTFAYSIPVDGKVMLEIYDIVGNKVKSLVDVTQSAGDYVLSLDEVTLQPGVYTATIKLKNNDTLITRTIKIISKQ